MSLARAGILIAGLCVSLSMVRSQSVDSSIFRPDVPVNWSPESSAFIRSTPYRTLDQVLSLMPGVILQNGGLHFRGGRADEVHYRTSGFSVTNPFTNRPLFELIPDATESIEVRTGPAVGEFGRALSGSVNTIMRTGSKQFELGGILQTDELMPFGHSLTGMRSYGHRDAVITAGGPMPFTDRVTFFIAGRHRYMRDRTPAYRTSFSMLPTSTDSLNPFPAPIVLDDHTFSNNSQEENTIQGTMAGTFGPFQVRLTGHHSWEHHTPGSEWPARFERFYAQSRNPELKSLAGFVGIASEYRVSDATTIALEASYASTSTRTVDPVFGETWQLYMDSAANAQAGYGGFSSRWYNPPGYMSDLYQVFLDPRASNNTFMKQSQSGWSLSANLHHAIDRFNTIEAGGTREQWTMRMYSISRISALMSYLYGSTGNRLRVFSSETERFWLLPRTGSTNNYGYDPLGNIADDGLSAPFHPVFGSAYLRYVWQKEGLTLTSALRYEYYNTDVRTFRNPNAIPTAYITGTSSEVEIIPDERLTDPKAYHYALPHVRVEYTTEHGTSLSFGFGSYAQLPALDQLYLGSPLAVMTMSPVTRGNAYLPPVGYFAGPERAVQVEAALHQPIGEQISVGVRGYVKRMWDLLTIRYQPVQNYICYVNGDEANAKGVELTLQLGQRTGLSAFFAYAFSEVRGSGSHPRSTLGAIEQGLDSALTSLIPLDHNQTHRATVLVSYRADDEVTGIFEGTAMQMQMTFNGGHNYSPLSLPRFSGSSELLMIGVGQIDDPRFADPVVPTGSAATPAVFNVDLGVSKKFDMGGIGLEVFAQVLNLFDTREDLNVYPTTGGAGDDGFLSSALAGFFDGNPGYTGYATTYRTLNNENRWSYMRATSEWFNRKQLSSEAYDLYGTPRQFRLGVRLTIGDAGGETRKGE